MKHLLVALSMSVAALGLALHPADADAKRLGGGKPAGMQRQMPAKPADTTPNTPASPAQTPGQAPAANPAMAGAAAAAPAAAAAAGKRSWLGPIAGLAAGIGLAALFSHLGWGEGLANFVMIALLAVLAVVAIRFVMRRFAGGGQRRDGQLAMAGAGAGAAASATPFGQRPLEQQPLQRSAQAPVTPQTPQSAAAPVGGSAQPAAPALPSGMDRADFVRLAKMVFIRMQAANDAANVDDLRKFTTPELFASLRLDLQDRGAAAQQTDVVQLDAEIADVAHDAGQDIVSVRFRGLVREQAEAGAQPFDELWHLVRPAAGGDWAIAGITPLEAATH
ncbi:MAG: Tim44 domain-containing protein [Burkholderiaceae bacterium]|nr:Tim44 domain-containing protein [Burkholderiaceae bacterium]